MVLVMININQNNSFSAIVLNKKVKMALAFFLMVSIILPAGSISGVPVKIISLLALLIVMFFYRRGVFFANFVVFNVGIIIFLLLEILLSLYLSSLSSSLIISQAKDIYVFFLMFTICLSFENGKDIFVFILETVVISLSLVGVIKFLIIVYSFVKGVPVSVIVDMLSDVFNVTLMNFDIENSFIARINLPSDSIILISVYYLVSKFIKNNYRKIHIFYFSLILFSALITMSRYQWATIAITIILTLVCHLNSRKVVFVAVIIAIVCVAALSSESVQNMISARFDANTISASDSIRYVQQHKILNAIEERPLLGHGLGYYLPDYVRNNITLYAYELQIPALIMQIGLIGTLIVLSISLYPILLSSFKMKRIEMISLWSITAMFIAAAFFNPSLFSSSGGAGLVSLYALSRSRKVDNS